MAARGKGRAARLNAAARTFERAAAARGGGPIRLTMHDDGPGDTRGFDRLFVGLGATVAAFPDALRDALPTIRAAHAAVFRTAGLAGRGGWPALSESWTVPERIALGYGGRAPILVRTGALRDHVLNTPAVVSKTADGFELRIAPTPNVGGVAKYRILARGGTTSLGTRIPARPMVALGPTQAVKVTSAISRSLRQRAAANGLG